MTNLHGKQGIETKQNKTKQNKTKLNKRVVHKWRIQNFKYFHNAVFYF